MKYLHSDGTVHFSDIKAISLSPAHYLARLHSNREPSRAMRIGTAVHAIVLGERPSAPVLVSATDRRTKAYAELAANNPTATILTASEMGEAEAAAHAVKRHTLAMSLVSGAECEVPLAWDWAGIQCSTRGVDVMGTNQGVPFIAELKTTRCAHPGAFSRDAIRMHYHSQLSWYTEGAMACLGFLAKNHFIIAVETEPPSPVVVYKLSAGVMEAAVRNVVTWMERLKVSIDNDHWPGYSEGMVDLELPAWMEQSVEEDAEEG